jgi:hypothetical protein
VNLSVTGEGLLDPAKLKGWVAANQKKIREATGDAMLPWGRETANQVRLGINQAFHLRGQRLPRSVRARLYASKPGRLPAVYIGSKVPWLNAHEVGANIRGSMLIPMPNIVRSGPPMTQAAFKRVVATVMAKKAHFWKTVNGQTYLFAEYQPEWGSALRRFVKMEKARTGSTRKRWAGVDIPIALLVHNVNLRPRLKLGDTARRRLPLLAASIESHVAAAIA